jgi:mono/diheme cytochrome c family protein
MKRSTDSRFSGHVLSLALFASFLSATASPRGAQGISEYCNFETPQVKPITIANLTSPNSTTNTFLLLCNTPDNAIEVWDITGSLRDAPNYVLSIPVGLEPVSVVFKRIKIGSTTKDMLYSVNWLGDSVTFIELSLSDTPQFNYTITKEVRVTDPLGFQDTLSSTPTIKRCDDEPMHLTVVDRPLTINPPQAPFGCGQFLVVTKRSASSYTMLHPFTGAVMAARNNTGGTPAGSGANVIMTSNGLEGDTQNGQIVFGQGLAASSSATMALKDPHTVLWRPGTDQFWVLGHKGGGSESVDANEVPFGFDFDLWGIQMPASNFSGAHNKYYIQSGLGTINFNMAFNASGSHLYVVGTKARNGFRGNGNLATDTSTGFVETMLFQIRMSDRVLQTRDLNLDGTGARVDGATQSLSHAVDVAVYEPSGGGTYVAVAAFNSSRLGLVQVTPSLPASQWAVKRIGVESEPGNPTQEDLTDPPQAAGPRGLAILRTATPANDRVYTLNRLDETVTIFDPNGGTPLFVRQLSIHRPTVEPEHIREGRKFLYSTKFSGDSSAAGVSGGQLEGFTACASCHVDARSDNLGWRLTARAATRPLISSVLSPPPTDEKDALEIMNPADPGVADFLLGFPVDLEGSGGAPPPDDANAKGIMVTQSLQGLSNSEVGGDWLDDDDENDPIVGDMDDDAVGNPFDDLVTNAPFHWRGDKQNFRHFNEAFVNLQGAESSSGSIPLGGLTTADMKSYERFIHSIHYPPNPLEPKERRYSGGGWQEGLGWAEPNELEDAADSATLAMRGLKLFHIHPFFDGAASGRSCVQCHSFPEGSNNRVTDLAGGTLPNGDTAQPQETTALRALFQKEARLALNGERNPSSLQTGDFGLFHKGLVANQNDFLDRFDPVLGVDEKRTRITEFVREFDSGTAPIVGLTEMVTASGANTTIDQMEAQADEANCGIAVFARVDVGAGLESRGYWYKLTAAGGAKYKRAGDPEELTRGDLLALLGQTGEFMIFRATPLGSDRRIASFALLSSDLPEATILTPSLLAIAGTTPNSANDPVVDLTRNVNPGLVNNNDFEWLGNAAYVPLSLRLLLRFQDALGIGTEISPGVVINRHDPSRRLQVTGSDLTYGAKIRLTLANLNDGGSGPPERQVELPIYPTSAFTGGQRIWETAVEFDALALYTMILGGPGNPNVEAVFRDPDASATLLPVDVKIEASNVTGGWTTPPETVPFLYDKVP